MRPCHNSSGRCRKIRSMDRGRVNSSHIHTAAGRRPGLRMWPDVWLHCLLRVLRLSSCFVPEFSVDMSKVPIFIEGSTDATQQRISSIASLISPNVYTATSVYPEPFSMTERGCQRHYGVVFYRYYIYVGVVREFSRARIMLDTSKRTLHSQRPRVGDICPEPAGNARYDSSGMLKMSASDTAHRMFL